MQRSFYLNKKYLNETIRKEKMAQAQTNEQMKAQLTETNQRSEVKISEGVTCGGKTLLIVGGPCSVESSEQMHTVAKALNNKGINAIRGGVYKPRTSPYAFQGMGEEGLAILGEISKTYNMPVITEVMSEKHADIAVHTADVLQIGSRNMQNFELLKHIGKLDKPVILKRGLSATLDEFLMAAEYIMAGGNNKVILCERGIRSYDTATRNVLDLGGVVALRQMTHLPIIVDPSHACGNREMVADLARAAIACGADGLMIECHPEPEKSVSDARQAISLEHMLEIVESLVPIAEAVGRKMPVAANTAAKRDAVVSLSLRDAMASELHSIRHEVDRLDATIATLLEKRLLLAMEVGELKAELKLPIRDVKREQDVLDMVVKHCSMPQIAKKVREIYKSIMEASRILQKEEAQEKESKVA